MCTLYVYMYMYLLTKYMHVQMFECAQYKPDTDYKKQAMVNPPQTATSPNPENLHPNP